MKKLSKKQRLRRQKQTRLGFFVVGGITLVCLVIAYGLLRAAGPTSPKRLVTFYDRGIKHSVLTRVTTVRSALQFANITIHPHDIVEPSLNSTLTKPYVDIIIYRSRPIIVIDGAIRQKILTPLQSPNEIVQATGQPALKPDDKTVFQRGTLADNDAPTELVVTRAKVEPKSEPALTPHVAFAPTPQALTKSKGAQVYVDGNGVAHRETYYDLPMNRVITSCGAANTYHIRSDGAKVDQDGYVLVAAGFAAYPRCSVVDTSMGPGKVYDTGGFVARHPYGFDLATDWTNYDGR